MSTFRAEVIAVTDRGVFVQVKRSLSGGTTIGPCPTLVPDLVAGQQVLVSVLDDRADHYSVLGPLVPPLT